jgi:hypothetical protein
MIASRLRRQAILYEPRREITVLMGEGALRTNVASPAVMHAQRERIARLAETLTTATIGVLPFTAHAPIATLHGWSLTDDIATIETAAGNLEIADPSTSNATGTTHASSSTPPPPAPTPPRSAARSNAVTAIDSAEA